MIKKIQSLLGAEADDLLNHKCKGFPKESLRLPGPDFIDRVWVMSDQNPGVLRSLASLFGHGRLAGTGYLSILPVDQGVGHSAGACFAPDPIFFDPENIIRLAMAGGCNAVASTLGVLGSVGRQYAHRIPFLVKLNHNEMLSYPNWYDRAVCFGGAGLRNGGSGGGGDHLFRLPGVPPADLEISEAFKAARDWAWLHPVVLPAQPGV